MSKFILVLDLLLGSQFIGLFPGDNTSSYFLNERMIIVNTKRLPILRKFWWGILNPYLNFSALKAYPTKQKRLKI